MTNLTTALTSEYQKVFPTKANFIDGRTCLTCATPLVFGSAFTATNDFRQWDNYCADCAEHAASQVRGLYRRAAALGDVSADVQDLVRLFLVATGPAATAALLTAKAALLPLVAQGERAQRVETLKLDPTFVALALATTPGLLAERDRSFAESLATQWETKGALSAKQMPYAVKMGDKARAADAKGNVAKPWTHAVHVAIEAMGLGDGYYAVDHVGSIEHQDTTFVRILTADDGLRFMRHIVGGQGETPAGGEAWCQRVLDLIAQVGVEGSMRRYGREIGRCCKCHRTLTDKPSRDAGIGPVCGQAGF